MMKRIAGIYKIVNRKSGRPMLGKHHSPESLKRMSETHIGVHLSEAAKKKISGKRSVAHRPDIKEKKRKWWDTLRRNPVAYAAFCKKSGYRKNKLCLCKKL